MNLGLVFYFGMVAGVWLTSWAFFALGFMFCVFMIYSHEKFIWFREALERDRKRRKERETRTRREIRRTSNIKESRPSNFT